MKPPPKGPEFARFTEAMRGIMKVSKTELQRRMEAEKRNFNASASRASGGASDRKRQNG